ncbi:MAG: hypothetical protein JWP74_1689 [Marmoricola sp.]|nr:hypothetical protein [Marmoricola sp.]
MSAVSRSELRWDQLREQWRTWLPDALLGLAVLVAGLVEAGESATYTYVSPYRGGGFHDSWAAMALVTVGTAIAVGLCRRAPAAALLLVWITCSLQVVCDVPVMLTQLTVAAVSFGTARWGRPLTVLVSAVSIPVAGIVAVLFAGGNIFLRLIDVAQYRTVIDAAHRLGDTWQIGAAMLAMAALGVPWLAGLTLRFSIRAASSQASQQVAEREAAQAQRETEQAQEIARLRDDQARMARDVHDVVGHSLAVILAQAEAAQYLPDNDTEKLKSTMATIATSARSSLQDVRQVLSETQKQTARTGGLDSLIDGVRTSGHEIDSTVIGTAQPLPPELDVVSFRVLQEMLTNAIRYGRRGQPVSVERHWDSLQGGDLRLEVRNLVGSPDDVARPTGGGQGLEGMRRRLEAVGGRLDVRRRDEADGVSFTTTAWIPVRPR